jgi:hypothetical protein
MFAFETAVDNANGNLTKVLISLDELRRVHREPGAGRATIAMKTGSQFASREPQKTWETYNVLTARLATLSTTKPVALMSAADWQAAQAAKGG